MRLRGSSGRNDNADYRQRISLTKGVRAMKDELLLVHSKENPEAFSLLYQRYRVLLHRAAMKILDDVAEAEDVVQEAFMKMYMHALQFEDRGQRSFHSWAYRITINIAITYYRNRIRQRLYSWRDNVGSESDTIATREAHERVDFSLNVKDVLGCLIPSLRRVVEKYYLEDKSYEEIIAEEKISLPTLKMRLFRARKELQQFVQKNGSRKQEEPSCKMNIIERDIEILPIPSRVVRILRQERGVSTVGDIVSLGRDRLIMTRGLDIQAVSSIEHALRQHKLILQD